MSPGGQGQAARSGGAGGARGAKVQARLSIDLARIRREMADCDRRLANYRALVDNGTDPATVAGWIRDVEIERAALRAPARQITGRERMTSGEIEALVTNLGSLVTVLHQADPADKAEIYERLGLRLTYDDETQKVLAEIISTSTYGAKGRVRGPTQPLTPYPNPLLSHVLQLDRTAPAAW